jgi:hypothetical protein
VRRAKSDRLRARRRAALCDVRFTDGRRNSEPQRLSTGFGHSTSRVIGWTLRDLAHAGIRGQLDAVVGGAVALLTAASWCQGDDSPFSTLDRGARWIGVDISNSLASADAWLNADHRRGVLIWACAVVFLTALIAEAHRLASQGAWRSALYRTWFETTGRDPFVEEQGSLYREIRFWCVVWTLAGLLSQLRAVSLGLVLGSIVVIVVVRVIAARRHFPLRGDDLEQWSEALENSVITGFAAALMVPFLLPATLLQFIVVGPRSEPSDTLLGPTLDPSETRDHLEARVRNRRRRRRGRPDASDSA